MAAGSLLADHGRVVGVAGPATDPGKLLAELGPGFVLQADLRVGGALCRRQGTDFATRVLILDRRPDAGTDPVTGAADTLGELASLLAQVAPRSLPAADTDNGEDDARFAPYRPARLDWPDARPHPEPLVESWAMAAVTPPEITYHPAFPDRIVTEGVLSEAQLEAVCYAGQAHGQDLAETA